MAHLISFSTARFEIAAERPNPINPIAGESVLNWIRDRLAGTPYASTEPDAEDWGWYISVEGNGSSYLVGASGEAGPPGSEIEWIVQVHRHRTLKDRLTGRNKMTLEDPLTALLERFVRAEPAFREIRIDRGA